MWRQCYPGAADEVVVHGSLTNADDSVGDSRESINNLMAGQMDAMHISGELCNKVEVSLPWWLATTSITNGKG